MRSTFCVERSQPQLYPHHPHAEDLFVTQWEPWPKNGHDGSVQTLIHSCVHAAGSAIYCLLIFPENVLSKFYYCGRGKARASHVTVYVACRKLCSSRRWCNGLLYPGGQLECSTVGGTRSPVGPGAYPKAALGGVHTWTCESDQIVPQSEKPGYGDQPAYILVGVGLDSGSSENV